MKVGVFGRSVLLVLALGLLGGCSRFTDISSVDSETVVVTGTTSRIVEGALRQVGTTTGYDPSYVALNYPMGDVPESTGVCSDVVVRAFRAAGFDLQRLIHEDMLRHFGSYPQRWGLAGPDTNIDHRRVPNLATFFARHGGSIPVTQVAADYRPGDVVTWTIGNSPHTGIVSNKRRKGSDRFFIVDNRGHGGGARVEDVLFAWKITGHYRWTGGTAGRAA